MNSMPKKLHIHGSTAFGYAQHLESRQMHVFVQPNRSSLCLFVCLIICLARPELLKLLHFDKLASGIGLPRERLCASGPGLKHILYT